MCIHHDLIHDTTQCHKLQVERRKPLAKMMGNHQDTMDDTNVRVDDNSKLQTPNQKSKLIYL